MSDRELRAILESVIADIDAGRLRVLRQRPQVLRRLGAPALAAAIALGAGACPAYAVEDYGVPPTDAALDARADALVDAGGDAEVDAGPNVEYMAPFLPPQDLPPEREPAPEKPQPQEPLPEGAPSPDGFDEWEDAP
jgi:hypothetical protein